MDNTLLPSTERASDNDLHHDTRKLFRRNDDVRYFEATQLTSSIIQHPIGREAVSGCEEPALVDKTPGEFTSSSIRGRRLRRDDELGTTHSRDTDFSGPSSAESQYTHPSGSNIDLETSGWMSKVPRELDPAASDLQHSCRRRGNSASRGNHQTVHSKKKQIDRLLTESALVSDHNKTGLVTLKSIIAKKRSPAYFLEQWNGELIYDMAEAGLAPLNNEYLVDCRRNLDIFLTKKGWVAVESLDRRYWSLVQEGDDDFSDTLEVPVESMKWKIIAPQD